MASSLSAGPTMMRLLGISRRIGSLSRQAPVDVALEHVSEFGMALYVVSQQFSVRAATHDQHVSFFGQSRDRL